MIYESRFWKDDLIKQANFLRAKTKQRRWTEASSARLEQAIMLGFYSIRKLVESQKLSNAVINQKITASVYVWKGKPVTRINWVKIDELYDLEKPKTVSKDLLFFCHQFVHSYVFWEYFEEDTRFVEGVFVSSDRERHRNLYSLSISQIIALFEQIGNDYPENFALVYNPEKMDYEMKDYVVKNEPVKS
jgi:hypothetical protein